ncbi:hypothetical protein GMOD_00004851 [Pyrenophora seminiperda CCB06]|uniref:Uncharacterized protein n=1 Tax=Pyrenophora seminiperda CCB06 TaxID=1302712 RepID=A0A3M7MHV3_9PLEO|nr:hypothetical protein GMOD_00004851 [Pyrenophora seminiperda CCB06]
MAAHPQPDASHFAARTLPSFAELTSSSTDSVLHRPRDSVPQPAPAERPASRATPPSLLPQPDFANPPPPAERATFTAINHASPHVRVPPSASAQDHQRFAHSLPQTTQAPFTPPLSSGPTQSLHDTTLSQTPVATARQDSAFSHLRYDAAKESEPTLPSSVFAFSYFHPAVGSRRQSNTSRPISHPAGPSSPHSPPAESRSNQQPPEAAGARAVKRVATSQSLSSGIPAQAEIAASPDQLRGPDTGFQNPIPSPTSDQVNSSGRHQRYNVRFNTVYTSENMPPNQKPRHDPAPTAPTAPMAAETNEEPSLASEQTITPSVEPATSPTNSASPSVGDQINSDQQNEPKLERCQGCNDPWRRPLPGEEQYRLSSPAQNMGEQIKLTEDLIKRLENHTKFADEAYAAWQRRHRWCLTSPPSTDGNPPVDPRSNSTEESSPTATPAYPVSAKRKSEIAHEASSKMRKIVSFDPPSNPTHSVRPTAPA